MLSRLFAALVLLFAVCALANPANAQTVTADSATTASVTLKALPILVRKAKEVPTMWVVTGQYARRTILRRVVSGEANLSPAFQAAVGNLTVSDFQTVDTVGGITLTFSNEDGSTAGSLVVTDDSVTDGLGNTPTVSSWSVNKPSWASYIAIWRQDVDMNTVNIQIAYLGSAGQPLKGLNQFNAIPPEGFNLGFTITTPPAPAGAKTAANAVESPAPALVP